MELFFFILVPLWGIVLALVSIAAAPLILVAVITIVAVLSVLPWATIGHILGVTILLFVVIASAYGSYLRIRDWIPPAPGD